MLLMFVCPGDVLSLGLLAGTSSCSSCLQFGSLHLCIQSFIEKSPPGEHQRSLQLAKRQRKPDHRVLTLSQLLHQGLGDIGEEEAGERQGPEDQAMSSERCCLLSVTGSCACEITTWLPKQEPQMTAPLTPHCGWGTLPGHYP